MYINIYIYILSDSTNMIPRMKIYCVHSREPLSFYSHCHHLSLATPNSGYYRSHPSCLN